MAELFSDLSGIRQPDALFNKGGPLPPTSVGALQSGFDATTSAQINATSTLLDNMNPYEYGKSDRISSDVNYKNTPVKVQKIVPVLNMPLATSNNTAQLSHSVDDGDIAFVLRREGTANSLRVTPGHDIIADSKLAVKMSRVVDAVINLPTLNYLLAILQETIGMMDAGYNRDSGKRVHFFTELGLHGNEFWKQQSLEACRLFLQKVNPFGTVIGSEKQGGQHEGGSTVDWPVNFITTLCVDGFCDNLVNFWRNENVHAGDDLVLHLEKLHVRHFELNHYYKSKFPTQSFGQSDERWQLIPRVRNIVKQNPSNVMHIARSQMAAAPMHAKAVGNAQNDLLNMSGALMQVTVQPMILGGVHTAAREQRAASPTGAWDDPFIVGYTASSLPLFRSRGLEELTKKRNADQAFAARSAEATNSAMPPPRQVSFNQNTTPSTPQMVPTASTKPDTVQRTDTAKQGASQVRTLTRVATKPITQAATKAVADASPKTLEKKQTKPPSVKEPTTASSKTVVKTPISNKASPKTSSRVSASIEGGNAVVAHVLGSKDSKVRVEKL
jgi:hypothetical protein